MIDENPSSMSGQIQPPVLFWFKLYLGVLIGLYLLCFVGGLALIWSSRHSDDAEMRALILQGILLAVCGPPFAIAHALPFVLPRKSWVWVYDLVLICGGMTSCCFLPASIPLLIYWIKPDVKLWFNRT